MDTRKVLLVGDIPEVENELKSISDDYEVCRVGSSTEAMSKLLEETFDVLVGDVDDEPSGALVSSLERLPDRPLIIAPASSTSWSSSHVHEHIEKPFSAAKILHSIERAIEYASLVRENRTLKSTSHSNEHTFVGASSAVRGIRERIEIICASAANVLITGESGVGKGLIACEINRRTTADAEMARLACDAVPDALFSDCLFGDGENHLGLLEQANGGTLLLEDVDLLPAAAQSRLTLAIQDGQFKVAARTIPFEARIVATTRIDLKRAVDRGDFREDLYYYLKVVPIDVPALRERRDDIALLAAYYVDHFARENNRSNITFTADAVKKLSCAYWRGNVRELRNVVERAVLLSVSDTLSPEDLRFDDDRDERLAQVEQTFRFGSIRDMEKLMILNRLRENEENRTRSSKTLDISVRTLRNKLRDYRTAGGKLS